MNSDKFKGLFRHHGSNLSIFHDLMPFRVREILLVATVYDAYILEREGQLFEQIYGEYYQLNLSSAPRVTSVYSTEEALELFEKYFDFLLCVITDVRYPKNGKISSRAGRELAMLVKNSGSIPVLMQSAEHENALFAKKNQISYIDKNSKNIYRELADFFKLNLGFGNFIFRFLN